MRTLKDYTDDELRHGIFRCKARLSGVMPIGVMSLDKIKGALSSYRNELERRGVKLLDFK